MAGLTEGKTIDDCRRDLVAALVNAYDTPVDTARGFLYEYEEKLYAEWAKSNTGQLLSRIQQDGYSANDQTPAVEPAVGALRDTGEAGSSGVSVSVESLRDDTAGGAQSTPDSGRARPVRAARQIGYYVLEVDERSEIETYEGTIPLSLHVYGGRVQMYALENPEAPMVKWTIYGVANYQVNRDIYGAHYIGSAFVSGVMRHYFYRPVSA